MVNHLEKDVGARTRAEKEKYQYQNVLVSINSLFHQNYSNGTNQECNFSKIRTFVD